MFFLTLEEQEVTSALKKFQLFSNPSIITTLIKDKRKLTLKKPFTTKGTMVYTEVTKPI